MIYDPCLCETFSVEKKIDYWGTNYFVKNDVMFQIGDRKVACSRKSLVALLTPYPSKKRHYKVLKKTTP